MKRCPQCNEVGLFSVRKSAEMLADAHPETGEATNDQSYSITPELCIWQCDNCGAEYTDWNILPDAPITD